NRREGRSRRRQQRGAPPTGRTPAGRSSTGSRGGVSPRGTPAGRSSRGEAPPRGSQKQAFLEPIPCNAPRSRFMIIISWRSTRFVPGNKTKTCIAWRSLWDGVSSHLAAPLRRGSLFPPPVLTERTAEVEATSHCPPDREDCTLTAWYRFLYAPRAGGAYDSHHRTAGIAGRTRRRGGRVAACGARPAASDTGDRAPWQCNG